MKPIQINSRTEGNILRYTTNKNKICFMTRYPYSNDRWATYSRYPKAFYTDSELQGFFERKYSRGTYRYFITPYNQIRASNGNLYLGEIEIPGRTLFCMWDMETKESNNLLIPSDNEIFLGNVPPEWKLFMLLPNHGILFKATPFEYNSYQSLYYRNSVIWIPVPPPEITIITGIL